MNTLLAILKVTHSRRDVILARGLNHRLPWGHLLLPASPYLLSRLHKSKANHIRVKVDANNCKLANIVKVTGQRERPF